MKKLANYFNSLISKQEEEEVTKALFNNYFDSALKEKWEKNLADEYNIHPNQKKVTKRIRLVWRIGAIAASILLLISFGKLYQSISQPDLTLDQFVSNKIAKPYIDLNIRKGVELKNNKRSAYNAYASKNFNQAVKEYEKIVVSDQSKIEDHFYYGLSHLYLNQPAKAIPIFQKAMTLPLSWFRDKDQIRWFLSLAYIENQQLDLAKKELQSLKMNNPSPKIKKDIDELLNLMSRQKSD